MSKYDVCYPRAMSLRARKCKQETGSENRAKRRETEQVKMWFLDSFYLLCVTLL